MPVLIDWEKLSREDETLFRLAKQAQDFKNTEYGAYITKQLTVLRAQSVEGVIKAVCAGDTKASQDGASLVAGIDAIMGIMDQPLYEAECVSNS